MDSWNKFNEPVLLVEDHYYSKLNQKGITKEDLKHVENVCNIFNIENKGDYHDFYVQSDTLLLADVFKNFRDKCIEIYELDPPHFLSAPRLAWQACLKKTNVELELLTDNDMLLMFEEGIRGGMCQATYRYAKANNKCMKNYDKNKESLFLKYLDVNSLYGWEMSKKLPVDHFKWEDDLSIFTEEFIKNYDENSDKGYILEVDIEYPKDLQKLHSDLPFLPERMKINKCDKLVCNVRDKDYCVIHILALKQALNHGLKLSKVHRVIEFRQKEWLKPYIEVNTKLRMQAKNDIEKDFFRLMNKSVFGKTMENVRNHRDIKILTTDQRRSILASEPNYHSTKYISKDLLIMEMKKVEVKMNKPIYLGQAILDISKTLMYEFCYDYIKPKYEDKARLCYMDTGSFVMDMNTEDIADDIESCFDTSNYDEKDKRPLPIGKIKR